MGDSVVSMTRRRYRLTGNPDFQLLHYTAISSESQKVSIIPSKIKSWPRDPALLQKMARGEQGSPTQPKKKIKTKVNPQVRVQETFTTENLGDELDGSVNRNVSMERYKRNHIFIDLIFSPFSAKSMETSDSPMDNSDDTNQDSKEDLKESLKEDISRLQSEISELESKFQKDKSQVFSAKSLHQDLDQVSRISELSEINACVEKWSQKWNCNLAWRPALVVRREFNADAD